MSDMNDGTEPGATNGPTLKEVNLDDVPEVQRSGKASKVIESFLQSGMQAAEIENGAKTFSIALRRYIKTNEVPVEVVVRGGKTYLRATEDA